MSLLLAMLLCVHLFLYESQVCSYMSLESEEIVGPKNEYCKKPDEAVCKNSLKKKRFLGLCWMPMLYCSLGIC